MKAKLRSEGRSRFDLRPPDLPSTYGIGESGVPNSTPKCNDGEQELSKIEKKTRDGSHIKQRGEKVLRDQKGRKREGEKGSKWMQVTKPFASSNF